MPIPTLQPQTSKREAWVESARFGLTPEIRLALVRDYATIVFGKELMAAAWLGQLCPEVRGGAEVVAVACQSADGFKEAMAVLQKIHEARTYVRPTVVQR
jgi:hypothetical protein